MITEHIVYFPHKLFDSKKEITDNLRNKDYIQYGYIKKRDLTKWENNEECAVKMGMLTPSNKTYRGKTIVESALSRIKEQDTTALFDDEDELIPIYVFVSEETDNEWRDYLLRQGFVSSRKNASREGIRITRKEINLHYGKHYGYDTEEVLSEKERKKQTKRDIELKQQKLQKEIENTYEQEHKRHYQQDLCIQNERIKQLEKNNKYTDISIDKKTLTIRAFKCSDWYLNKNDIIPLIFGTCILLILIGLGVMFYDYDLLLNENLEWTFLYYISWGIIIIPSVILGYMGLGGGFNFPMGEWIEILPNGEERESDYSKQPSLSNTHIYYL